MNVLVAGSEGGIGGAIVTLFKERGHDVFGIDLIDHSAFSPEKMWYRQADLTNDDEVTRAISCLPVASLDLVVFAAGKADNRPSLQELDGRRWRATMDNNLTACYLLCRATHALLKDASASVVLLSSIHGITAGGPISGPAYAAAKAGVLSLTRYLAREWAPDKIRVNAIAPGAVKTPMVYSRLSEEDLSALKERIPLRKFAEPREIAEAVEYLSLAKSVTGTTIVVSNGEHER